MARPAAVAVDPLVEIPAPDLPGTGGQDMSDAVAEHMLRDDLPVVQDRVTVRAVAAPP